MERYLGLDVHAASCTLAVISQTGKRLKDFPVETNGQALVEAIRMIPGHKHLVFEEGLQSAWLYETLRPHVDEVVVAGITESRGPKSDKRDAYGLAEKLRVGDLEKQVFKAPRQFTRLRELSRIHMTLVGDVVRAQARIKSLYRSRGILVSGMNVYGARPRERWQKQLCSSAQTRAARLYDHLDFLLEQKEQAEADLLREAKKHPIVRILETAPGFGPIRAARLVPIVVTPHRFRTKRQFWSYCGLGIVTRSSSDWVQTADGGWIKARMRPAKNVWTTEQGRAVVSRVDELKLDGLSLLELEELSDRVAKEIVNKREARSRELREEMAKLAEREGLTLEEVIRAGQKRRRRQTPEQKYRNPAKPSQDLVGSRQEAGLGREGSRAREVSEGSSNMKSLEAR